MAGEIQWMLLLWGWLQMAVMMTIVWLIARAIDKAAIVDLAWTVGIAYLAVFYAITSGAPFERALLVSLAAGLWSARLTWHMIRRLGREREDGRYLTLKEAWGKKAWFNLFFFFQLQALADVLLTIPILVVLSNMAPGLHWGEYLGFAILLVSVVGEGIADRQLDRFRHNPENKGKTCREGLWRYSRHPNYFFEWLHWVAYVPMGILLPWGWLTLFSPLLMLHFIINVTGIPPTEAQAVKSRGDDYRRYQKETSPFFPWFPKKVDA